MFILLQIQLGIFSIYQRTTLSHLHGNRLCKLWDWHYHSSYESIIISQWSCPLRKNSWLKHAIKKIYPEIVYMQDQKLRNCHDTVAKAVMWHSQLLQMMTWYNNIYIFILHLYPHKCSCLLEAILKQICFTTSPKSS